MSTSHKQVIHDAMGSPLTRRRFIQAVAALGGTTASWSAMSAWGHMAEPMNATPPALEGGGKGTSVVILGAGPAGLVAGYELQNKGYTVHILEASDRVGGHVFTVHKGRHNHEIGHDPQTCEFDEGQWVDLGAWRIPYSHHALHHYLHEFHIPTIMRTDLNMNAYAYMEGIKGPLNERPVRIREAMMDMRGYTSELLAKAVDQDKLDTPLTDEDRDILVEYLVETGLLSRNDLSYGPNTGRGASAINGGVFHRAVPTSPIPLEDLLPFISASGNLTPFGELLHQPVMMKPVNGMSEIYESGFFPHVEDNLTFQAEVREIHQSDNGVEIVYMDKLSGDTQNVKADYCLSTLPLGVFVQLPKKDVSESTLEAMRNLPYFPVGKIGLQFKRRFWEQDEAIYGGMTMTNNSTIGTISYPAWDMHTQKGVLQAYYNFGNAALEVSKLSHKDRIEHALKFGSKIHPQYRDEFETGFSVAWHNMPYALGGWATPDAYAQQEYYPRLAEPDGRIYFAGDFLSHVPGWQEGAIEASWIQIEKLHERAAKAA